MEAFAPIARTPFAMHHGHDPDTVGLIEIDHGVGKMAGECAPRGRADAEEAFRLLADFGDDTFDLIIKLMAQLRSNRR